MSPWWEPREWPNGGTALTGRIGQTHWRSRVRGSRWVARIALMWTQWELHCQEPHQRDPAVELCGQEPTCGGDPAVGTYPWGPSGGDCVTGNPPVGTQQWGLCGQKPTRTQQWEPTTGPQNSP